MKVINCPILGERPVTEFAVAGVLDPEPADLAGVSPGNWVFNRTSLPMQRQEWWYHGASQLWFLVERDTASDQISKVKLAGDFDDA